MLIIADGGLSSLNTFDTMEAVLLTKNINYIDGVKLDIRKSLDNRLVLSKYDDLSKFTLCHKLVHECNYDFLRKVKFPSHIFKYYIPTLDEVLNRYNQEKIMVLEIYHDDNLDSLCNILYNTLSKYSYKYFFISNNDNVLNTLRNNHFQNLGEIVDNDSNIKLINKIDESEQLTDSSVMIITTHPEKIHRLLNNSTKN